MNLRQLEIFTAIVETSSFTEASRRLNMAQPAVSIALKKLESYLDIQLVCRSENITPTAEGKVLLQHAKQLLNTMQMAKQAMSDLHALDSGLVRFSTTPILGQYFFPDKLRQFHSCYPHIDFEIIHQETIEKQEQLHNQQCDMAIVDMGNIPKDMEAVTLSQQEIVVCTTHDHPLATHTAVPMSLFLQQTLILYQKEHALRKIVTHASNHLSIAPTILLESDLTSVILQTISQGMGVGLCLRSVAGQEAKLITLPFKEPLFLNLGLGWKKNAYLSSANKAFIAFLDNTMEK